MGVSFHVAKSMLCLFGRYQEESGLQLNQAELELQPAA
jgi:hypothetical protein